MWNEKFAEIEFLCSFMWNFSYYYVYLNKGFEWNNFKQWF